MLVQVHATQTETPLHAMFKKTITMLASKVFFGHLPPANTITSEILLKSRNTPMLLKHITAVHMQRVLPLSEACTLPWHNPLSGKSLPISAAQLPRVHAPQVAASPASQYLDDAGHSAGPQSRGDRCSYPRYHSAER